MNLKSAVVIRYENNKKSTNIMSKMKDMRTNKTR